MALSLGDRPIRPLTQDEVMRMVEAGILHQDDHVELLGGVLTQMSPQSPQHAMLVRRLVRWLIASDPTGRYDVGSEHPLAVPDRHSLPEPDVAVMERDPRHARAHPTTALLVIEVSVSSLATHVEVKAPLYAGAGVPEYWVVDVPRRRLRIFAGPRGTTYAEERVVEGAAAVSPSVVEAAPLALDALFDGL